MPFEVLGQGLDLLGHFLAAGEANIQGGSLREKSA